MVQSILRKSFNLDQAGSAEDVYNSAIAFISSPAATLLNEKESKKFLEQIEAAFQKSPAISRFQMFLQAVQGPKSQASYFLQEQAQQRSLKISHLKEQAEVLTQNAQVLMIALGEREPA